MKHPDPAVRAAGLIPKLALAAISLVLCLIGGELIGRLVWGAPTFLDERVLFVSSNTWHRSDTAAVRYSLCMAN